MIPNKLAADINRAVKLSGNIPSGCVLVLIYNPCNNTLRSTYITREQYDAAPDDYSYVTGRKKGVDELKTVVNHIVDELDAENTYENALGEENDRAWRTEREIREQWEISL